MSTPLVTIGIPFYNNQDTLLDSIKSIFAQTLQDWELLLVDDGSTDNSLQIAQSIDDPRVRVFSDGANKRLPARLNQIIEMARGKYIARMDADDLCSPKRIEKQLELFQKDPKLDVVGTGMVYLDDNAVPLGHRFAPPSHSEICREPGRGFALCHPSVIAKRFWYKKYRYDESVHLGQDFNLWLKSYRESKFANVPDPLHYYRLESSFRLKKQCRHRCTNAAYLFKHYREQNRLGEALLHSFTQYIKMVAEIGFCAAGLKRKLLARRYKQLDGTDIESYRLEIQKIKETKLPIRS